VTRVLVTGATGFIGRQLVPQLLDRGHDVVALARDEDKARRFDWFPRVRFVACDLETGRGPEVGGPGVAVHLAWPNLDDYLAPAHYEATLPAHYRFLKSLVEGGLGHLLVAGTCFEYGPQQGSLREEAETRPSTPYALAKDTLRRFLESLRQRRPFTLQWARLFYMYGPGQNPASLLASVDRAIDSGAAAFDMSAGERLRDYLPVEEVARRLVLLLEHPECEGVVNVCRGEPISVRRLVEEHVEGRGARLALNLGRRPHPAWEPPDFWGNGSRLAALMAREVRS
jgi:dTDP-6-deoxy-L-talose 4-dehydrogenase (NAD+)